MKNALNEIIHTSYYFYLPIVSVSACASCVFQACLLREYLHAIIFIMIIRIVSFQSLMKYMYWYRKKCIIYNWCIKFSARRVSGITFIKYVYGTCRPTERGAQPGRSPGAHQFITIHQFIFVVLIPCLWHTVVDLVWVSLFGDLEEGEASFFSPWGPKILLAALGICM